MSYSDILLGATLLLTLSLLSIAVLLWMSFLQEKRNTDRQWQLIEQEHRESIARENTLELPALPRDVHKTRAVPRAMPTRAMNALLRDLGK